jgi:nucleoside 2-deoxyribosyltransferase
MALKIYLAGPDVFLTDARGVGEQKKAMCRDFGFEGLFPLDNDADAGADAAKIFQANCSLMRLADVGLCNLTPFRSPSADPGTVFELSFLFAQGKPVYGYTSAARIYRERVAAVLGPLDERNGQLQDRDGYVVEDFGLGDNLMLVQAIQDSGGVVTAVEENTDAPSGKRLAAFQAFKACLQVMSERIERVDSDKPGRSRSEG